MSRRPISGRTNELRCSRRVEAVADLRQPCAAGLLEPGLGLEDPGRSGPEIGVVCQSELDELDGGLVAEGPPPGRDSGGLDGRRILGGVDIALPHIGGRGRPVGLRSHGAAGEAEGGRDRQSEEFHNALHQVFSRLLNDLGVGDSSTAQARMPPDEKRTK